MQAAEVHTRTWAYDITVTVVALSAHRLIAAPRRLAVTGVTGVVTGVVTGIVTDVSERVITALVSPSCARRLIVAFSCA